MVLKTAKSALFLVLSKIIHFSLGGRSFITSFHSSGKWNKDEWIEYKDDIPSFNEFTACHWEKIEYFSDQINTVWSYCMYLTKEDPKLRCLEVYYLISSNIGRNIDFKGWIDGWTEESVYIEFKKVPYHHQRWNHFCWTYSNQTGMNNLYHNGEKISSVDLKKTHEAFDFFIPGSRNVFDSSFIIGQEPDSLRGGYSESQGFPGDIGELNIWNTVLKVELISSIAKCANANKGNLVMWTKEKFDINLVKTLEVEDPSIFCQKQTDVAIFPQKMSFENGIKLCSRFGGTLALPISKEENTKLQLILPKHKNACIDDKNYKSSEKVKAIWLGAVKSVDDWYKLSKVGNNKLPISYTNWYGSHNGSSNADNPCPYMYFDGSWGYGREKICKSMSLCVLCSFSESPLFTLKGQSESSLSNEWNYYMFVNESFQVDFFEGATKKSKIVLNGDKWEKISKTVSENMKINSTKYPVGRNFYHWWSDTTFESSQVEERICTFSVCIFGEEYTCDSGECVSMDKRCDTVYDCDDSSDEEDCDHVIFPKSYKKERAPMRLKRNDQELYINALIKIEKIDFIDTLKMKFGATFQASMSWKDERLEFKNIHQFSSYSLSETVRKKLWLPINDLYHKHAVVGKVISSGKTKIFVEGTKHDLKVSRHRSREDFKFFGGQVNITIVQRFRVEYNCLFDLQKYPFEKFSCHLGLKIEGKDHEKFLLTGHPNKSVLYLDTKNIEDFRIDKVENNLDISLENGIFGSSFENGLVITIWIKRSYVDQIVSVFCPSILFWILAYCTMFLDIDDVSNRSRTSVTVLLVLLSLLQTVKEDFPKTTYYKLIDVWFLWYIANIFAIIFYQILIPWIKSITGKDNQCVKSKTHVFPFATDLGLEKDLEKFEDDSATLEMKRINKALAITFPILFFIFNVVYFLIST